MSRTGSETGGDEPRVTEAMFLGRGEGAGQGQGGGAMGIHVTGENFLHRAMPLLARLGQQMVSKVVVRADGRGFTGVLEHDPREGDRLYLGYAGRPLRETAVVFRGRPSPTRPNVA